MKIINDLYSLLNISKKKYGKLSYIPASTLSEIIEKRKKEVKLEKDGNVMEILDLYVLLNKANDIFSDKEKKCEYDLELKRMIIAKKQSDEDQNEAHKRNIIARQDVAQLMYDEGFSIEEIQVRVNFITDYLNGEYIDFAQELKTIDYFGKMEAYADRIQMKKNNKRQGRIMIRKKRNK